MDKNKKILLTEIGKELPFTVPQNYFEQSAINIEYHTSGPRTPVRQILGPWMYMAAMFVGILFIGSISYSIYQKHRDQKLENYESYLLSQIDDVSLIDFYMDEFDIN